MSNLQRLTNTVPFLLTMAGMLVISGTLVVLSVNFLFGESAISMAEFLVSALTLSFASLAAAKLNCEMIKAG